MTLAPRRSPASVVYVVALAVTSGVLATSSPTTARRILLERSTNLHELGLHPLRVLVASAFWLPSPWQLALWAPLFLLVVAPLERLFGSLETIGLFALGHVGATLLTALGLWIGLRTDVVEHSIAYVQDVGPSYGFMAILGAAAARLLGVRAGGVVAFGAALLLAASPSFTNVGHLLAVLLGLAAARVSIRRRTVTPRLWRSSTASGRSSGPAGHSRRSSACASASAASAARRSS